MAAQDLAVRFTEETYATRREVSVRLGTSLIEPIWNNILAYRAKFARHLGVYDVTKAGYTITFTLNVLNKLANVRAKLNRAIIAGGKLPDDSLERYQLRREMEAIILRSIAANNDITIDEVAIDNVIQGRPVSEEFRLLADYLNCLHRLESKPLEPLDEDLLAEYYSLLLGETELTSFYRTSDFKAPSQKLVIGREYVCAPTGTIEPLVENLLAYVSLNAAKDYLTTAIVACYQMDYIKPFAKNNDEMALLLFKAILAQSELRSIAPLIPVELIFSDYEEKMHQRSRESQRTRDLTYFLITFLDALDEIVGQFLDAIVQKKAETARREYLGESEVRSLAREAPVAPKAEAPQAPAVEKPPEPSPMPVQKQVAEAKPVAAAPTAPEALPPSNELPAEAPDEKALRRMEEDLIEMDPALRPHQAHFYVRHRTAGRYYTIQQYKRAERTVYETARTAMDKLARRGYYRRESVKNKFVYTPALKK